MSRSFQIVEYKISEAEFFLDKLNKVSGKNLRWGAVMFYFSAFLSSSRSITFTIQASVKGNEELENLYEKEQEQLRIDDEARFFVEARNLSEKVGYYPISNGRFYTDEKGKRRIEFYFDIWNSENLRYVPEDEVRLVCTRFFSKLLAMVSRFYIQYGHLIDPEKYFSIENMHRQNKTIEDFEEEIGFPRGWTEVDEITNEIRMKMIRETQMAETIDWIFCRVDAH